jgi:hypothetical protein
MSPQREVRLDVAAFLDSPQARALDAPREDARALLERFLTSAYDELGQAPHLLEGDDLAQILAERLPRHFGARDPLARHVPEVLGAWLDYLVEHTVVPHAFEQRRALDEHMSAFLRAVEQGELAGTAPARRPAPFVHRAEKTGRNDPCPCGSGKKFKQCCMR